MHGQSTESPTINVECMDYITISSYSFAAMSIFSCHNVLHGVLHKQTHLKSCSLCCHKGILRGQACTAVMKVKQQWLSCGNFSVVMFSKVFICCGSGPQRVRGQSSPLVNKLFGLQSVTASALFCFGPPRLTDGGLPPSMSAESGCYCVKGQANWLKWTWWSYHGVIQRCSD